MPASVPSALTVSPHASLACSCQHLGDGVHSSQACSRPDGPGVASLHQRLGSPPPHRWDISRDLPHPAPRAPGGTQLPLPSADMLHVAPCVGCLPFPVSESFRCVPTGISWEPISSKNLTLESWSPGLLQKELMPRYPLD